MVNPHLELIQFVLERAENEPVSRRARLLRALASICGDQKEQQQLGDLALHLERADALCREFNFSFVKKLSGGAQ